MWHTKVIAILLSFSQFMSYFLSPPSLFEEKQRDIVFGFPWCVVRGAWFRVYSRYLVSTTPPTVFN